MIHFVFNKTSGTYTAQREELVRSRSEELFLDGFNITYTKPSGDIFIPDILLDDIQNDDTIVAVGGDGTINLCLQFIHDNNLSSKVSLGFIPAGTGNNMLKIAHLSKFVYEALDIIKRKKIKKLQYGTINDKKVFFNFSLGFTSHVLENRKTSTLHGYVFDVLRSFFRFSSVKVKISFDKMIIDKDLLVAFFINTTHYLSFIRFLKQNNQDSLLTVFYLTQKNKFRNFLKLIPLLLGISFLKSYSSTNFEIELQENNQVEVDGDIYRAGERKLSINNSYKIRFISG